MPDTTTPTITPTITRTPGVVGASNGAPVRVGHGWACPDCDLSTGRLSCAAEAVYLAGVHDQVCHRGRVTAVVLGGTDGTQHLCESCRRAPATQVWDYPPAGAPFALCARCAPVPAPADDTAADDTAGDDTVGDADTQAPARVPARVPAQLGPGGVGGAR